MQISKNHLTGEFVWHVSVSRTFASQPDFFCSIALQKKIIYICFAAESEFENHFSPTRLDLAVQEV